MAKLRVRRVLLITVFALSTASRSALAQTGFKAAIWSGYNFGHVTEALSLTEPTESLGRIAVRSELVWPLDVALIGGTLDLRAWSNAGRQYGLFLKGAGSVSTPSSRMTDSDWIAIPQFGISETRISYTESEVKVSYFMLDGVLRVGLTSDDEDAPLSISVMLGFRYAYHGYDAFGVDGVQSGVLGNPQIFLHIPPTTHAGYFEAQRMGPYLALDGRFRFHPRLLVDINAGVLAVVARDHDDHVLRGKEGKALASGGGVLAGVRPRWEFWSSDKRSLAVGANVEFEYYACSGTFRQRYYADDPATPGDETRQAIPDADYQSNGLQSLIAAFIEAGF